MSVRHTPFGSGHPYVEDTEQRSPTLPIAGEAVRIGARATSDVVSVDVAWTLTSNDGTRVRGVTAARQVPRSSRGQSVDGGHLASAQARKARSAGGWSATLQVPDGAVSLEYRLTAATPAGLTQRTRVFRTDVARWTAAPDTAVTTTGAGPAIIPGSVRILATATRVARVRFSLPLAEAERVAGFGERFDRLDQRGTKLDSVVFEQYKSQGEHGRTYLPMPFAHVVGGSGWGFHVETSRRVWFDVGASQSDVVTIEAETDAPLDAVAVSIRTFAGEPRTVLDAFLARVGRPTELPAWVFRLWASGNEWNTQAEVERQVALHREHRIPIGALVIEAWSDESTFTAWRDAEYTPREDGSPLGLADFTFPAHGAWPDPLAMVEAMHREDIRVLLWQIPLIKMRPHPSEQARHDADAAVREGRLICEPAPDGSLRPYRNRGWWFPLGLMPDLTDPDAAYWWTEKRRYLVEEMGIDGFKTDGGEHAWGAELAYLDGTRGDERNNTFPVAYAAAYGDLLRRNGKAPVTFSRAGFTGSQSHGAFWAGDENSTWEAFRWSMIAGLSAASSGIVYWGWDIAGFSGPTPDAELYVRAFAASAFVPIMQYHSEYNHHRIPKRDRTPWHIAEMTGDPTVISEVREIVALRERLLPYLEEQARESVATSVPLMRPLFFDYPQDEAVWEFPVQWTLGNDILVAPVLEPGTSSWDAYVPAGTWRDAWSGDVITGPAVIATITPRHRVPVFVRESAWKSLASVFEVSE